MDYSNAAECRPQVAPRTRMTDSAALGGVGWEARSTVARPVA
jgi:hypothetical protein